MLEQLYEQYYGELYAYLYSLCGSTALAEDILQETFLKALLSLKDSHTNMRAWLYMVARNLYYDTYRRERRMVSSPEPETGGGKRAERGTAGETGEDVLEEILRGERQRELRQALEQLAPRKREILLLQYFGGFRHGEIAAMLHLSPEHVRLLAFRAKKELRILLDGREIQK